MGDFLAAAGSAAGFLAVGAAAAWTAYVVATRILGEATPSERLAATALLGWASFHAVFELLSLGRAFAPWTGGPLVLAAAAIAWRARGSAAALLAEDRGRIRSAARELARSPWGFLAASVLLPVSWRLLRAGWRPPMGWDALVYHLTKAGRWVQLGGRHVLEAPDAWGAFERLPAGGSVPYAWALGFSRDGLLLPLAGAAIWLAVALGGYAAARKVGARRVESVLAAACLAGAPAIAGAVTLSYVDTTVVAGFVLGIVFASTGSKGRALVWGVGWGLACTVKPTLLPATAAAALYLAFAGRRTLLPFLLGACPWMLAEYLPTWLATGNPLYPLAVSIGGHEWLSGNAAFMEMVRGTALPPEARIVSMRAVVEYTAGWGRFAWSDVSGFGPGLFLVTVAATLGMARGVRERSLGTTALVALVAAAAASASLASADTRALFSVWLPVLPRHLGFAWAALVIVAARATPRASRWAFASAIVASLLLGVPHGNAPADLQAFGRVAPVLLAAALLALAGRRFRPVLPLALVVAIASFGPVRDRERFAFWCPRAGAEGEPYDGHFLDAGRRASWGMLPFLEGAAPTAVAVTSGWDGTGKPWYLFPLMGSRLQHRVVYVPPTIDGSVVDYARPEELQRKAQLRAWLERLLDRGVGWVVTLAPSPPERVAWMGAFPDVFVPVWEDPAEDHALFRLDAAAARRRLSAP